jgi:N-methylhydantoinase A
VTDADVLLGLVDAEGFAGGSMPLDLARARAAAERLGASLGMQADVAAVGIREVVDETMANAARVHAVEGGHDLATFTMVAFGGAAPVHAGRLAEKLGIGAVLVPPGAGVGSAIGFLAAPFAYEAVRGAYQRLSAFDAAAMEAVLADLAAEAEAVVRAGAPDGTLEVRRRAFMRYHGQGWEIPVDLPSGPVEVDDLAARFEAAYVAFFGRSLEGIDVEVMTVCVRLAAPVMPPPVIRRRLAERWVASADRRKMFDPAENGPVEAAVVTRAALAPGEAITGPAAITEAETTTIVPTGFTAVAQDDDSLLLVRGETL